MKFRYLLESQNQKSLLKGKVKTGYSVLFYHNGEFVDEELLYKGEDVFDAWLRGVRALELISSPRERLTKLPKLRNYTHYVVLKAGHKIGDDVTMYARRSKY